MKGKGTVMRQAHQSAVAISEAATVPSAGVFYGWWIAAASFVFNGRH
jgi:hypothetical protein